MILLVDDLSAELDKSAQAIMYQNLFEVGLQLFISGVGRHIPEGLSEKEFKMFHVEHGTITPRKPN